MSRNNKDITAAWPELLPLAEAGEALVLDGEIVAFSQGRPSFAALQQRPINRRQASKVQALAEEAPVTYMIFDILHRQDQPLIGRPYTERRDILEGLGLSAARWDTPPRYDDVAHAYAESARLDLEGLVAKRLMRSSSPRPMRSSATVIQP